MSELSNERQIIGPDELRLQLQEEWATLEMLRASAISSDGQPLETAGDYLSGLVQFQTRFHDALPSLVMAEPKNRMLLPGTTVRPLEFYPGETVGPTMLYAMESNGLGGRAIPLVSSRIYQLFRQSE